MFLLLRSITFNPTKGTISPCKLLNLNFGVGQNISQTSAFLGSSSFIRTYSGSPVGFYTLVSTTTSMVKKGLLTGWRGFTV